jgi:AmmeMemoRadiSam system protein A
MKSHETPDNAVNYPPATGPERRHQLTNEDKQALLALARQRLVEQLDQSEPADFAAESEAMLEHRATFVTWRTRSGELRGCIGEVIAQRSLVESIERMAVASGTQDPRFPPIDLSELPHLTVEISALTPMTSIKPIDVEVGRHGLMIAKGQYSGLLLPQVPLEQGWGREEFLRGLCAKAGLPSNTWQDQDAQLRSFEAEVWGEEVDR